MRKFLYLTVLGSGLFLLTASDTSAQSRYRPLRGINDRQQDQHQRIRQGVRSGELTARETGRLVAEQVRIDRMEDRFRASGDGLSASERARLQRQLNQASRHIYLQKHDGQDYPGRRP